MRTSRATARLRAIGSRQRSVGRSSSRLRMSWRRTRTSARRRTLRQSARARTIGGAHFVKTETMARQNAGRSSGKRDVIRFPSTTHSWSTQSAPAFRQSSRTLAYEVIRRPLTIPALIGTHAAWQIAATTLRPSSIERTKVAKSDRKSTRLNSSHITISYAVFCLKKKNKKKENTNTEKQKAR